MLVMPVYRVHWGLSMEEVGIPRPAQSKRKEKVFLTALSSRRESPSDATCEQRERARTDVEREERRSGSMSLDARPARSREGPLASLDQPWILRSKGL